MKKPRYRPCTKTERKEVRETWVAHPTQFELCTTVLIPDPVSCSVALSARAVAFPPMVCRPCPEAVKRMVSSIVMIAFSQNWRTPADDPAEAKRALIWATVVEDP